MNSDDQLSYQKESYPLIAKNKLINKSSIYKSSNLMDNEIKFNYLNEKLTNYEDHKLIFEKVISNFYPNEWRYIWSREIQEIIPGLYLGSYAAANKSKKSYLLKHGITHIICIRNSYEANWIRPQHKEFNYLTLNIDDSFTQNIIKYFDLTNQFIFDTIKNGGRVLVHSNAGISRSSAIVIAFIMFYFNCNSKNAIKYVQNFRFCICPNESFISQLKEYEPILKAQLMKKNECRMNFNNFNRKRSLSNEEFEDDDDKMSC